MTFWKVCAWVAIGLTVILSILSLGHFLQARGVFTDWFTIGPIYKSALALFRAELLSWVLPGWLVPYLDGIAHYIALVIRSFLALFDIHWSLRPDWKDIIVPLWLYFGKNALANRKADNEKIVGEAYDELTDAQRQRLPPLPILIDRAKRGRAIFVLLLIIWGFLAALLIATATGLTPAAGSSLLSLGWFLAFFAIYELGSNALVATLVPYVGESWLQSFKHHFRRTQQNILWGVAVGILAAGLWLLDVVQNTDGVLALLIFLYITLLGVRDCLNPIPGIWQKNQNLPLWKKWHLLQERAQFQLGQSVLIVVLGVIVAVFTKI